MAIGVSTTQEENIKKDFVNKISNRIKNNRPVQFVSDVLKLVLIDDVLKLFLESINDNLKIPALSLSDIEDIYKNCPFYLHFDFVTLSHIEYKGSLGEAITKKLSELGYEVYT